MNRNILISSLLIAGFFMVLSFILRLLFFTNYVSLIQQPLVIFVTWFGVVVLIFYFLKNDFPEIYKQFIFFEDKDNEVETEVKGDNLDLLDEDETDYNDVFNYQGNKGNSKPSANNKPGTSSFNKMIDNDEPTTARSEQASRKVSNYQNVFDKEDPKKLAGLIKNYLNKE